MTPKNDDFRPIITAQEVLDEAIDIILAIGGGRPEGDTYQRMLHRVAERSGIPYVRLWKYFYRKIKGPLAHEVDMLRASLMRELAVPGERLRLMNLAKEERLRTRRAKPSADDPMELNP